MKKLFSLFLAALFILPQTAFAAEFSSNFPDVEEDTVYAESIIWMSDNGVIDGYSDGSFKPDDCVNRVEFLKMLFETLEMDTNGASADLFSDTPEGEWYIDYLEAAVENGTVIGYPDGTFKPDQCVNRVEAIKMAVLEFNDGEVPNSYGYYGTPLDVSSDEWYFEYLEYALNADLVGDDHYDYLVAQDAYFDQGDYYFDPAGEMSRKEVAELLYRLKTVQDNRTRTYSTWYEPYPTDENLFTNECTIDHSKVNRGYELEDVLPEDSQLVFNFNHNDNSQYRAMDDLLGLFPESEIWETSLDGSELDLLDILLGEWELIVGYTGTTEDDFEIYVAATTEEGDSLENFLAKYFQKDSSNDLVCETNSDSVYWTTVENDGYFARSGDFFLVTNKDQYREDAMDRADSRDGFDGGVSGRLSYLYVDVDEILSALDEDLEDMFGPMFGDINDIDDLLVSVDVQDNGVLFSSELGMLSADSALITRYEGKSVDIADRASDEGLVLYSEDQGFDSAYLDELSIDFLSLEALADAPYAFSLHLLEDDIPGFVYYVNISDAELAEEMDIFIASKLLYDSGLGDMLIDGIDEGTGLNTFTLDRDFMSSWEIEDYEMMYPTVEDIELYYGLIEEDMYIVALYPNFPVDYAHGDKVADNNDYKVALSQLGSHEFSQVSYMDLAVTWDYALSFFDQADLNEVAPGLQDIEQFMNYFASGTYVNGQTIFSDLFVRL